MKNHSLLWLPLTSAILLAGCASTHPMVGAWQDSHFSPARTDKIAITLRPNPSEEDAELGRMLTAELKREKFNLVPLAEADYTLAYVVEDVSDEGFRPAKRVYMSGPPQTTQQILDQNNDPRPYTVPPPDRTVFHSKAIRLCLYTNPKTHSGIFQMVWMGSIDAGENISAEREPLLIKALLDYFGQEYAGPVNLAP